MKSSLPTLAELSVNKNLTSTSDPIASAVRDGLTAMPKWLPAWLFYDDVGSGLFEQITALPEYYPTRTERAIFTVNADSIIDAALRGWASSGRLRLLELGAGTATKTGILLAAAIRRQGLTQYLPIDVSEAALEQAEHSLARLRGAVKIVPQVANYVTDALAIPPHSGPTLALYIGSSIGNFAPKEAVTILRNLRAQMRPGDSLLLGTDLIKDEALLVAAYDDALGVTAAFNLNVLERLNRDLDADFDLSRFRHRALWNCEKLRIEMHLESTVPQTVRVPGADVEVQFQQGETIHTENSYKFTAESVRELLAASGFDPVQTWRDERDWFAVTLGAVTSKGERRVHQG